MSDEHWKDSEMLYVKVDKNGDLRPYDPHEESNRFWERVFNVGMWIVYAAIASIPLAVVVGVISSICRG